jgi:Importin beta binding domain
VSKYHTSIAIMSLKGDRRKGFMRTLDPDVSRRKREDNIVELRKSKRDENLQKKRMVFAAGHDSSAMEDSTRNGGAAMQQKVHTCFSPAAAHTRHVQPRRASIGVLQPVQITVLCTCSWRACRPWCKGCGVRIRRRSWTPPHSFASFFQLVG